MFCFLCFLSTVDMTFIHLSQSLALPSTVHTGVLHSHLAGPESKVPTGILEAELELFPRATQCLEENVVRTQLDLERGKQAEQDRRFLEYAKHWWREYLDIKPAHQDRLIKIFALVRC